MRSAGAVAGGWRAAVRFCTVAVAAAVLAAAPLTASVARKAVPGAADVDVQSYVESNTLAIFYHELGHALIDVMRLPVLGQEEGAADVLSVLLFDHIFVEEDAEEIARDAAISFLLDAAEPDAEPVFWDEHGLDLQRFYTLVCLHYGAAPDRREAFRVAMELPDERAAGCVAERDLAEASWGVYLADLESGVAGSAKLRFLLAAEPETEAQRTMVAVLKTEVADWNDNAGLPESVTVVFDRCDEINAFYVPEDRTIVMCAEYADYLAAQRGR